MNLFIKQVDKLRIKTVTKPRTYILWNNTDEGRDKDDCYERVEENGFVKYINTNNINMRVVQGDDFFNTLEELYNCALVNEAVSGDEKCALKMCKNNNNGKKTYGCRKCKGDFDPAYF